ncbi:uncharacterized protein LOC121391342 [Gigantopelta aegis]|uniref:uncharacterized protein LOC121391342 n=1 Tax=Gigantopelta aegis TaxID=1735272 RepID=UPI001B8890EB|nr:uncharacterized protein LOC121391342 [Gigantopelta aegis]
MCTDESISSVQGVFLDGFVPGNTDITCNCSLQATTTLQIGISHVSVPEKMCGSQLTIQLNRQHWALTYNCRTAGNVSTFVRNIDEKGASITLKTSATHSVDITYCINFYTTAGSGSLSLQCYSPGDKTTVPMTTQSTTKTIPVTKTDTPSANKACPIEGTQHTNFPVVHMFTDESTSGAQGVFLDGFVPGNTGITCNCSLQATTRLQIGISQVSIPEQMCGSQLNIYLNRQLWTLTYSCRTGRNVTTLVRNIDEQGYSITLQTSATHSVDITYCINFYITAGSGSLSLQCYSSGDKTTVPMPTQPTESTITVKTVPTTQTNSQLGQEDFPVAAVAGGVGAVVLMVVAAIVVVVFIKRKKATKENQTTDDDGHYEISDVNPNNADANTNNNVNPYNTDDNVGNTYEHLQHNTVQYVNTPSSVDEDHVYLHVNEPTQGLPDDSQTTDYYNSVKQY